MTMKLNSNDIILFSGDSITNGNRGEKMDCNHIMGHGYQSIVASVLALENAEKMPKFINKGYSGFTMGQLLERWQEDVIENKPTLVSILAGTNDGMYAFNASITAQTAAEKYYNDLSQAVIKTKSALPDVKIMILEPFYFPLDNSVPDYRYTPHPNCEPEFLRPDRNDTVEQMNYRVEATSLIAEKAEAVAEKYDCLFVPLCRRFREEMSKSRPEYFIWDGTHPTIAGHALIAREWMKTAGEYYD